MQCVTATQALSGAQRDVTPECPQMTLSMRTTPRALQPQRWAIGPGGAWLTVCVALSGVVVCRYQLGSVLHPLSHGLLHLREGLCRTGVTMDGI